MLTSEAVWDLLSPVSPESPSYDAHGASHSRPMEFSGVGSHPARKRSQSNVIQTSTSCDNVQLTLVFNDGGTYDPSCKDHIMHDPRPPINKVEARELAMDLRADIIVNVGSHDATGLEWDIETSEEGQWRYTTRMQHHRLAGISHAATTTLQRTKPGAVQNVELILVRIIKGGPLAETTWFFGAEMRQTVMFTLFDMLLQTAQPAIMIGNFGMSLISVVRYAKEYEHRTSIRLIDQLQFLPNADQELLCVSLHTTRRSQAMMQVDAQLCPQRMFVVTLVDESMTYTNGFTEQRCSNGTEHKQKKQKLLIATPTAQSMAPQLEERPAAVHKTNDGDDPAAWKYTDETSGGAHHAGKNESQREIAKPRAQKYIELMSNLTLLSELQPHWSTAWEYCHPHWHLHPVAQKSQRKDGTQVFGPVDMQATLQRLDGALKIAEEARKQVGITSHDQTLTNKQRAAAFHWLQYGCFEKHFTKNPALWQMIIQFEANPDSCQGQQLKTLKGNRRGAFKAWKHSLLGSNSLFDTILCSGIFETADLHCYLLRHMQEIQKNKTPNIAAFREQLRMNAVIACNALKKAKELAAKARKNQDDYTDCWHMTRDEFLTATIPTLKLRTSIMQLLTQFDAGTLQKDYQAAEDVYRYRQEVMANRITLKDAVLFQSSIDQMHEWNRVYTSDYTMQ